MIDVKKNEYDRILLARITLVTALSLLGGLAVGIAYAQQQPPQQQEQWSIYQNASYGVRMLYPSNWTQQNSTVTAGDDRFILVSEFFSPEEADRFFVDVTISIDTMPRTTNMISYRDQSIDIYRRDPNFKDLQVLSASMGNFTLAGLPAYSFEISYTDPEFGPQNMLEVGRIFKDRVYYIQYFADPPIYGKYFPTVERMIESFETLQ
ncbi:MAG TPA: PsbP-related protein [Nitrososphaeraceae archaeon]|nr:PsbP-related protein [Nitrososphaeraceae archaeon]